MITIAWTPKTADQAGIDQWAKANGLTVTYADWHPNPEYRAFKTGSLLSRNEGFPSGLVLVDNKGIPHPFVS